MGFNSAFEGLNQGVHFGKRINGIRTELKLDMEVEFGAERIVMMHVCVCVLPEQRCA
jgi:hypothetical protein